MDNELRLREWINMRSALFTFEPFRALPVNIREETIRIIELSIYKKNVSLNDTLNEDLYLADLYSLKINIDITSSVTRNVSPSDEGLLARRIYRYAQLMYFMQLNIPEVILRRFANMYHILDIQSLAVMNPQLYNNNINGKYFNDVKTRADAGIVIKTTRMYLCKCGERRAKTTKAQTRGLDEAETLFIECVACGNSWRQSN